MEIVWRKTTAFIMLIPTLLFSLCAPPVRATESPRKNAEPHAKRLALTFDDGPHPVYTSQILSVLEKYSVKATFFVIGSNVVQWEELVRSELERGHEVGNHTYSHENRHKNNLNELYRDVFATDKLLSEKFGCNTTLFRPPEGTCTREVREVALKLGYKIILWNADTRDWANSSTESIVKSVMDRARDGDIVLFHDYIVGESHTCEALEILIPRLLGMGFEFVTVSELIKD